MNIQQIYSGWSIGTVLERELALAQEDFVETLYPAISRELARAMMVRRIEQQVKMSHTGYLEVTTIVQGPRRWDTHMRWERYIPDVEDDDGANHNM
jgi:hypothetical protein